MCKSINRLLSYFLLILFILGLILPTFLSLYNIINPNFNNVHEISHNTINTIKDATEIINRKPQTSNQVTRGQVYDQIIHKNLIRNITADTVIGNLTIRDDATLNVIGCDLEIRGMVNVRDNGRIFIRNSNVTIAPGPVEPQDIIINFSDNANIRLENSNLFTLPQPSLTNISYLLSDDISEVTIVDSYMNCKLPAILNLDIELTPPTAGTFILTGECNWNIYNTKIDGFLNFKTENGQEMLASRWFLFTLQRSAELYMKNSYGFMNDNSQPFIKPVAGFVKLEDCSIPDGVIDVEVVAEFEAINLSIVDLNLRDQTTSTIKNSKISNSVDLGSVAIIPGSMGEMELDQNGDEKPKSRLFLEDTSIGNTLIARGNSTSDITDCTIDRCSISADASVNFDRCKIITFSEAKGNTTLIIKNTSIPTINIADRCKLEIYQNPDISSINKLTTHFNCQSEITAHSTTIKTIDVFAGDQIQPKDYGPAYEPDRNISKLHLNLFDTTINQLKIEDDAELFLTLLESVITDFSFKKFKEESIVISIVDLGSEFPIPDPWPEVDLDILIYHRMGFKTSVNSQMVKAKVSVIDSNNEHIKTEITNEQGELELDLLNKQYTGSGNTSADEYNLIVSYLGFTEVITIKAEANKIYPVEWQDNDPPRVSNIKIDTAFQRTERGTRIQAEIVDSDVKVIANATLYYQYKKDTKWSEWRTSTMIEIDNNTYEGEIEQLSEGAQVRFYILVYDVLGNKDQSDSKEYTIPNTGLMFTITVVLFLLVIFILILLLVIKRRAKLRKYLNKSQSTLLKESNLNEKK